MPAGVGGRRARGLLIGVLAAELQFGGVAAGGGIEFGSGGEATAAATAGDAVDVVGADGTADANQGHRHGGLDLAAGLLVDRVAVDGADVRPARFASAITERMASRVSESARRPSENQKTNLRPGI